MAREALPATLGVDPLVVDPRGSDLERPRPHRHLAGSRPAVAHHLGAVHPVPRLGVGLEIRRDLFLERCHQHPSGSLTGQLVQRRRDLPSLLLQL